MEQDFEPSTPVLQKSYYEELDKLYQSNITKYRLILDIMKANKEVNSKLRKRKPPLSFFKNLIDQSEKELQKTLKIWKDLKDEEWYLPDINKKSKQTQDF